MDADDRVIDDGTGPTTPPAVKGRRKRAVDGESRKAKFKRLADARKKAALRDIRLIGNLADRRHYEYTSKQAAELLMELRNSLEAVEEDFRTALLGHGGLKLPRSRG